MKNKLSDLNNYLFEQIERLNDDNITDEELEKQLHKTEHIQKVAETIIKNSELQFKAMQCAMENGVINQKQLTHLLAEKN